MTHRALAGLLGLFLAGASLTPAHAQNPPIGPYTPSQGVLVWGRPFGSQVMWPIPLTSDGTAVVTSASGGGGMTSCEANFSTGFPLCGQAVGMLGAGSTIVQLQAAADAMSLLVSDTTSEAKLTSILATISTAANQTNALQKTMIVDGSGNVVSSTSNALNVNVRMAVTPTDKGSTIATGGTAQTAIASNASRKGGWVQNPCSATEDLYVSTSGSAVTTAGTPDDADLAPCGSFSLVQNGNVITAAVSVNAVTTAHAFIAKETQ